MFKYYFAITNYLISFCSYPIYNYINPYKYSFFYLYGINLFFYIIYLLYSWKYLNLFYFLLFITPILYKEYHYSRILELFVIFQFFYFKRYVIDFFMFDDGSYSHLVECLLLITTLLHYPSRSSFLCNPRKLFENFSKEIQK